MKTFTSIILLLISNSIFSLQLAQAIAEKKVQISWTGADYKTLPEALRSNGFAPKMQAVLENKTAQPLDLELEEGYLLQPQEQGYQAMLITQNIEWQLQPRQKQQQFVFAMCTQLSNSGPGTSTRYRLGAKATAALLQLAQFIRQKNYQNQAAQQAVWCITDNAPLLAISSPNTILGNDLQEKVARILQLDLAKIKRQETRNTTKLIAVFNGAKLDRNIPFKTDTAAVISVGFFDANGELLQPIFSNRVFQQGQHSIRYNPFPLNFRNQHYSVKLLQNGAVQKEYYFRQ